MHVVLHGGNDALGGRNTCQCLVPSRSARGSNLGTKKRVEGDEVLMGEAPGATAGSLFFILDIMGGLEMVPLGKKTSVKPGWLLCEGWCVSFPPL